MKILFIHQNFPGQYRHLASYFSERGGEVKFLTQPNDNLLPGVEKTVYRVNSKRSAGYHPLTVELDDSIRTGAAAAEACRSLRDTGFRPDIVVGHCGWGETLFVKDVFPNAPLLVNCEFFYHSTGADVGFDPEHVSIFSDPARLLTKNGVVWLSMDTADWAHSATRWQKSLFPPELRPRITAIHEGVDTDLARPYAKASFAVPNKNIVLTGEDQVVTYVARNLEPYRGFHIFMRALPKILKKNPRAHVVIVGSDDVSYGARLPPGMTFRKLLMDEVGKDLDRKRVHFAGRIPYGDYLNLLQISSAHVYLTYPFVLSWSFIEAMACGCLIVASSTAPVLEVIRDGKNGLLVDFFSTDAIANRVTEALKNRKKMQPLRQAARKHAVSGYDLKKRLLPRWETLIGDLVKGKRPAAEM